MNLLQFDLNLLRVLDALLREGSTVRAGQRIGLSQPAVSAALGRLRHALGDPLFVRQGQHLVATDFARTLEIPLHSALDQIQQLLSGPLDFDPNRARHTFKISGSDFFAQLLMPPLAEELSQAAPGVVIQLVDLVPDNYVKSLESRSVDLALIPKTDMPEWVDYEVMFTARLVPIARAGNSHLVRAGIRPGQEIPIDLFCSVGHVLFSPEGRLTGMGDAALARAGHKRKVVMTMPVFMGVCGAVSRSDFLALVPHQVAERIARPFGLEVYAAPIPVTPVELCMVWHKRSTLNPAHTWLRGRIAQVLDTLDA